MKNVLLIAGQDQQYYFLPFVQACAADQMNFYVFDPARFPESATLGVSLDREGRLGGLVEVLACEDSCLKPASLSIDDIDIAWYLRESGLRANNADTSVEFRFMENESRATVHALLSVLDCVWVNRKETVHFLSSNKFYQQLVARRCGLSIPRTLISNNPNQVLDFSDREKGLLLKSMGYIRLDDEGKYFLYSERFSHQELSASTAAIRACPSFYQEYVEKRYEHRVMAIGCRVISCRIDSQASAAASTDWRHYDFDRVKHVRTELPPEVQRNVLGFMKAVDLRFGALDLIETPEGDFVFLEVNPSGQWGWIADLAGIPVAAAVAEMLAAL